MRFSFPGSPARLSALCAALFLVLSPPAPLRAAEPVPISTAATSPLRQEITVSGTVLNFRPSSRANIPNSFQLKDESGSVRVAVWPNVFQQIPFASQIGDGVKVRVTGEVAEYRGNRELHVRAAAGLELAEPPAAAPLQPASPDTTSAAATAAAAPRRPREVNPRAGTVHPGVTPIGRLSPEHLGEIFTLQGKLTSARRPSTPTAPYVLRVTDPTGSIDLVFWEDLAAELPESKRVEVGEQLQVTGTLGEHRDSLQLRLSRPDDLKTQKSDPAVFTTRPEEQATTPGATQEASASAAAPPAVAPADLASLPLGRRVRLEGRVTAVEPVRLGNKVRLQADGQTTGPEALILLWDTAHGLKPAVRYLKTSSTLSVAGTVASAEGQKVLVVGAPEDVLAVTP